MNINENFPVSNAKIQSLKTKIINLGIDVNQIEEQFTRGGGKGGQKRNKTSNVVILSYAALNLIVRSGQERQRSLNRFLALRELVNRIERILRPHESEQEAGWQRLRKQKDRRRRRQMKSV